METIKKDLSISMGKTQILVIPATIIAFLLLTGIYYLIWGTYAADGFFDSIWFWISLIVGIIIHEAIHGITWMIAGKIPKDKIAYGFQISTLTPYAHSKLAMPKKAYQLGAAMPGILLGLVPYLIGLVIGHSWIIYFGIIFIVTAAGDALILWLIRDVGPDELVKDHPTRAGCYVVEEQV